MLKTLLKALFLNRKIAQVSNHPVSLISFSFFRSLYKSQYIHKDLSFSIYPLCTCEIAPILQGYLWLPI